MALIFQDAETRNPVNQTPPPPPVDPCAAIKEERDLMNQFLEELGHAITYDLWRSAKDEVEKMQQQYNENGGFEEIQ